MRRLYRSRKAVSPVIATVLMIMITMIGMTLLFAFVSYYSENYKAGIGSSVMESITVEDIWLKATTGPTPSYTKQVEVSLYNVGKVDSVVNSIYVNGLALTANGGSTNLDLPIKMGEHVKITAYWTENWVSYNIYTFKISTKMGSNFNLNYTAP
jgi:flagellin-like protein